MKRLKPTLNLAQLNQLLKATDESSEPYPKIPRDESLEMPIYTHARIATKILVWELPPGPYTRMVPPVPKSSPLQVELWNLNFPYCSQKPPRKRLYRSRIPGRSSFKLNAAVHPDLSRQLQ